MAELGDMLRDARTAKGLSLAEVERDTKIRAKYISALEDNHLADLPGPVYARGFLRNYAAYLGLDDEQVIDLFEEERQPTRNKIRAKRGEPVAPKPKGGIETINIHPLSPEPIDTRVRYGSSYIAVSLLALPLIILFYFIYSVWGANRSANVPIPTPRPPTLTPMNIPSQFVPAPGTGAFNTPTVAVAVKPPPADATPVTSTLPVTVTTGAQASAPPSTTAPAAAQVTVKAVTTRDAWMRVMVDGAQQFSGTVPSGSTRQWTGKRTVRIRTGRADAVNVTVNGANLGLMQLGTDLIVEKEWDRTGAEKVIR
ncbi:MAG: RodZ domain-containing protein [Chloroflexia bacterium]